MTARVVIDLETPLITAEDPFPAPVALGWTDGTSSGECDATEIPGFLVRVLSEGATLAAHNAAFDLNCIAGLSQAWLRVVYELYREGRVLCTAEASKLADIRQTGEQNVKGYGLDTCVQAFVPSVEPPDKSDPWRLRWAELIGVPRAQWPAEALAYLRADVQTTWRLLQVVGDETDAARQAAIDFVGARTGQLYGFVTDRDAVRAKVAALSEEMEALRRACSDFFKLGGTRKAPAWTKHMESIRTYAEAAGVTARTDSGLVSVTEDSLDGIGDDKLSALAKFLQLEATVSRLGALLDAERVRCRYKMLTSGRRGAGGFKRKAGDPGRGNILAGTGNVQNLPRPDKRHPHTLGWREMVRPRDGYLFAVNDFTGLELATVAECLVEYTGASKLAEAIRAGKDPHQIMGAQLCGQPLDAFEAACEGLLGKEAKAYAKAQRQIAKVPNFGLPGGLGVARFCDFAWSGYGLRLTEARASEIRDTWRATWPEFREYFARAARMADFGEPVVALRTGRIRGTTKYTEICNTPFQGLGADVATSAWFEVMYEAECVEASDLYGSRVVLFAHDELVTETPASRAAEAAERQTEIMGNAGRTLLDHVPLDSSPVLCDAWSKDAETVRDAAGRLTLWHA